MKIARVKAIVVVLLACAGYSGAQAWRPHMRLADTRPPVVLESVFPKRFANWILDENQPMTLVSPDIQAVMDKTYNQTLSRTYVNHEGDRIMLSVAYGGDQSDATRAHRPEVCYPVQGFQILSTLSSHAELGGMQVPVRQLVAQQGGRVEPITYWITVGDKVTLTGTEQKLAQLSYSSRGIIPDGMLVRVSSIDRDTAKALATQQQFLADLAPALPASQRSLVIGKPGA